MRTRLLKHGVCELTQEYGIGNSQHDAYFNLLNRWEFEGKA